MPQISVVMPVYNAGKYLREAIDSILNQTYTDFEFIIIDDGSTDSSPDIVRNCQDPRIRFYQNEHNMGVAATLNRGLELATGEYIARMDSDDIAYKERFEIQVRYLDSRQDVAVCGSAIMLYDGVEDYSQRTFSLRYEDVLLDLLFSCAVAHPTVMMRRRTLVEHSLSYELEYKGCEDYRLWTQIARVAKIENLSESLLHYRKHPSQVTAARNRQTEKLISLIRKDYFCSWDIAISANELMLVEQISDGKRDFTRSETDLIYKLFCTIAGQMGKIAALSNRYMEKKLGRIFFSLTESSMMRHRRMLSCKIILHRMKCAIKSM